MYSNRCDKTKMGKTVFMYNYIQGLTKTYKQLVLQDFCVKENMLLRLICRLLHLYNCEFVLLTLQLFEGIQRLNPRPICYRESSYLQPPGDQQE